MSGPVVAEHCEHTDAPGDENCPVGQEVHADAPVVAMKVPAGHVVHGLPAVEYVPLGQGVHVLENAPETEPCGHGMQDVAPVNE